VTYAERHSRFRLKVVLLLSLKYKNGDDVSDSIGLLISILVRYPEVGTINFDPQSHELKLTFIVSGKYNEKEIEEFLIILRNSMILYHQLERIKPQVMSIDWQSCDNYTILDLIRDVDTLSHTELSFIIELFETHFNQVLVMESNEQLWEEDLQLQDEIIGHMLESIKNGMPDKKLIAYREEGKVLVFNL
jgi:hypothetical protein